MKSQSSKSMKSSGRGKPSGTQKNAVPKLKVKTKETKASVANVTDRQHAEKELRESEALYRILAEASQDMIILIGRKHKIEYVNAVAARQFGMSAQELIGKSIAEVFPPEIAKRQKVSLQKVFESGEAIYMEAPNVFPAGTIWLGTWLTPVKDEGGDVHSVLVVSRDVTERRDAEEQSRQREKELTAIYIAGQRLQHLQTVEQLAQEIIQTLEEVLEYEYAAVLINEGDDRLTPFALSDQGQGPEFIEADKKYIASHAPRLGEGITGWVAQHGESLRIGDVSHDPRYSAMRADIHSELCVPLRSGDAVIGVVNVESKRPNAYSEADQRVLETVATQIGIAIQNAHLYQIARQELAERRKAEEAQRETEKSYDALVENSLEGMGRATLDGKMLAANPALVRLNGYDNEAELLAAVNNISAEWYVDSNRRAEFLSILEQQGEVRDFVSEVYRHKTRERIWINESARLIRDADGKPLWLEATIQDITERKHAEEALHESEEKFSRTFYASPVAISITRLSDGRYIDANDSFLNRLGYQREEVLGKTSLEVGLWADPAEREEMMRIMREQGLLRNFETGFRTKSGETGIGLLSRDIVEWGGEKYIIGSTLDITERKQAEAQLHLQSAALESAANGIVITDKGGAIQWVNPAWCALTGYSSEEAISQNPRILKSGLQDDAFYKNLWDTILAGNAWHGELVNKRKDGSFYTEEEIITPVRNEQGEIAHFIAIKQDITERKHAEEEIANNEKRFRALIENSADYISLLAGDGSLLWESPSETRMLGYAENEFAGRNILEIVHPDDLGWVRERFAKLASTPAGRDRASFRLRHQDGSWRWIDAAVTNLLDEPAVKAIVINYHNVTERKQAENELKENEDRYRDLVEHIHDLVGTHDLQGNILSVNPAASKLLGIDTDVLLKMNLRDILVPELRGQFKDYLAAIQKDGHASGFMLVQTKDGERRIWEYDNTLRTESVDKPIVRAMARDVTESRQAQERIKRQLARLTALSEIDRAITSNFDMRVSLSTVLKHVLGQLGVDAADILLLNTGMNTLDYSVGDGFRTKAVESARVHLGEGHAGRAALERRLIQIPDLKYELDNPLLAKLLAGENFKCYYSLPLIVKGKIKGVLEVFHRSALHPDQEWLDFLGTLAGQAAIAIDNVTLFDGLQRSNIDLRLAYDATIEGWSNALDLRDKETEGHTKRVTETTLKLAAEMGMSDTELVLMRRGGLLHDMGKLGVPDTILLKPGPLTDEEWVLMRKHPQYAYDLLSEINFLKPALDIPYCHHEKWDGTGYPRGLKGEQIPLAARVFAVVDVFDALTSDRLYRPAWTKEKALEHIKSLAGIHFDPDVVQVFLEMQ